jgi:1-acyl-sn-glycerol-3-phosphate acyltransferase
MIIYIGSALIWAFTLVLFVTILFTVGLAFIVTFPFDKNRVVCHRIMVWFGQWMMYMSPGWKFEIEGKQKLPKDHSAVVISNHQSFMDMPMHANLPFDYKWVSRSEIFKIPIMGWFMKMSKQISIERGKGSVSDLVRKSLPVLEDGISVIIFPEGTRSRDNKIMRFKPGAFLVAEEANVPIVPIVIEGAYNTLQPSDWKYNLNANLHMRVLDEMHREDYDSVKDWIAASEQVMRENLADIRGKYDR